MTNKHKWLRVGIVAIMISLYGCAGGSFATGEAPVPTLTATAAPPQPTLTASATATATPAPTATHTPEPTHTNTPLPPTATVTPTVEILPLAGTWQAKGVGNTWSMVFEITRADGTAFLRIISPTRYTCSGSRYTLTPTNPIPFQDGKIQTGNLWSAQVISPDRIEGTLSFPTCGAFQWVGTLDQPANPTATLAP